MKVLMAFLERSFDDVSRSARRSLRDSPVMVSGVGMASAHRRQDPSDSVAENEPAGSIAK